jgi:hypothetical protein
VRWSEARLWLPEMIYGRGEEKLARTAEELAVWESSGSVAARNDYGGVAARESCGGAWDSEEARLHGRETARRHGCTGARWRGGADAAVEKARRCWRNWRGGG